MEQNAFPPEIPPELGIASAKDTWDTETNIHQNYHIS